MPNRDVVRTKAAYIAVDLRYRASDEHAAAATRAVDSLVEHDTPN